MSILARAWPLALPLALTVCATPAEEPAAPAPGGSAGAFQDESPAPQSPSSEVLEQALAASTGWLAACRGPDGLWSDGAEGVHDVGVSGLALLALMEASPDGLGGEHADLVRAAARTLAERQDPESGLVGDQSGHAYMYRHGVATLALCELYGRSGDPELEAPARRAIALVHRARNPYAAWRYDVPPTGENDTSVTGWMLQALLAAERAGIEVDGDAYAGGLAWIDEVTDPASGRVGYDSPGSLSSRIPRVNDHLPPEMGEAMTAVGLASRADLGQDPERDVVMLKHAELLRRKVPEPWDGGNADLYYWYHGTHAMQEMGGAWWDAWRRALSATLVEMQVRDGELAGSWDPVDPWSPLAGRVYTTALATLSLAECR